MLGEKFIGKWYLLDENVCMNVVSLFNNKFGWFVYFLIERLCIYFILR